ncbi:MAG: hypothetical protein M1829_003243 [Trizodia sp. TS-e1964]|nr:MAG: hypothetical protein M1829_003243 [Trizodia sp. TS-e1964]
MADQSRRSKRQRAIAVHPNNAFENLSELLDEGDFELEMPSRKKRAAKLYDSDFDSEDDHNQESQNSEAPDDDFDISASEEEPVFTGDKDASPQSTNYKNHYMEGTVNEHRNQSKRAAPATMDRIRRYGNRERMATVYGNDDTVIIPLIRAREKWNDDIVLPSKTADKAGSGGLGYSFFYNKEAIEFEAGEGWDWYYETNFFQSIQKAELVDVGQWETYLPPPLGDVDFLLGPAQSRKLYHLKPSKALNLSEAFPEDPEKNAKGRSKGKREAWILNTSGRVECIAWVPNQSHGTQYIALSTEMPASPEPKDSSPDTIPTGINPITSPAFARKPGPSNIQIWAVPAENTSENSGKPDFAHPPTLHTVICTDWGEVKQIKWCPFFREKRAPIQKGAVQLGLLAAVWGDGRVRVIEVEIQPIPDNSNKYIKYTTAIFTAVPPDSICACVDWINSSTLAVGCANGFCAIWSLMDATTDGIRTPTPLLYEPLHPTYIVAICVCRPSHPYKIVTSSMDGFMRLTDLQAPQTDKALTPRIRMGQSQLAWCDTVQALLAANPENDTIRACPLRHFSTGFGLVRSPGGMISCLDVGTVHPCILAGTTSGVVFSCNPMRRLLFSKTKAWLINWFIHDWASVDVEKIDERVDGDVEGEGEGEGLDLGPATVKKGTSRFTEGSHPVMPNLVPRQSENDDPARTFQPATIYNEESGITAVAWNPNLAYGGWAAAATGSGLLRIEDISVEVPAGIIQPTEQVSTECHDP